MVGSQKPPSPHSRTWRRSDKAIRALQQLLTFERVRDHVGSLPYMTYEQAETASCLLASKSPERLSGARVPSQRE
jgi:hypothetical protein